MERWNRWMYERGQMGASELAEVHTQPLTRSTGNSRGRGRTCRERGSSSQQSPRCRGRCSSRSNRFDRRCRGLALIHMSSGRWGGYRSVGRSVVWQEVKKNAARAGRGVTDLYCAVTRTGNGSSVVGRDAALAPPATDRGWSNNRVSRAGGAASSGRCQGPR